MLELTNRPGALYRCDAIAPGADSFLCRIISAVDCRGNINSGRWASFKFDFAGHNGRCFVSSELAGRSTCSCGGYAGAV